MYRAVTWVALQRGIPIEDESAITALAESLYIVVLRPTVADGRQYTVLADGTDVTWRLREPEVDRYVSPVSAYRGVRAALTAQQRHIGESGGVVMVGRDIGSVVLPNAEVKIYLDASVEERARRRHREAVERGQQVIYDRVLEDLRRRDRIDSTRSEAPLCVPERAVMLDSTHLTIEQVVAAIEDVVQPALATEEDG